jgi:hypothetical protein
VRTGGRHVAPAEHLGAFLACGRLDGGRAARTQSRIGRQEDHADGVGACPGQRLAECNARFSEEGIGNLEEQPRAVAGGLVAADGAAVLEIDEYLHRVLDDVVVRLGIETRDEPYPATVMLPCGIVESVRLRTAGRVGLYRPLKVHQVRTPNGLRADKSGLRADGGWIVDPAVVPGPRVR